jgi:hypothetical protein
MAMCRYSREASFDQHDIERLRRAYEAALELLRLRDRQDTVTELIAAKIIQVWRLGENDPPKICTRAIAELGIPVPLNLQ